MRQFLIFIIILLSGCIAEVDIPRADYNHARRATIEAWEYIIGPVSLECEKKLRDALVSEVDKVHGTTADRVFAGKAFVRWVGQEMRYLQIHILASYSELQKMDIAVHEFIHALAACQRRDIDPEHMNSQYWIGYGPDTVEAWGCANL